MVAQIRMQVLQAGSRAYSDTNQIPMNLSDGKLDAVQNLSGK